MKKLRISRNIRYLLGFFCVCVFILLAALSFIFSPLSISHEITVDIPKGYSLVQTAEVLQQEGVIKNALSLRILGRMSDVNVKAGSYLFQPGINTILGIKQRLVDANYGNVYLSITLQEGMSLIQMREVFKSSDLTNFDAELFDELTLGEEGYLFPDTYSFLPKTSTEDIVDLMKATFSKKIKILQGDINASGRSLEDLVIMASLIEKESGRSLVEKKTVSGILWKRIAKGMLLQIDAPFLYVQGKTSAQLSISDLRTDGPYNTYTRKGLTPGAIGNPGLASLKAALFPTSSLYFFYLHDNNGGIHYGVTHEDHIRNKQRYL